VLANGKDNSLARTAHNDGVLEEDYVGVRCNIIVCILVTALLGGHLGANHVWEKLNLVHLHIHFFEEETVSGDAIAFAELDNVANDDVPVQDGLASAHVAT